MNKHATCKAQTLVIHNVCWLKGAIYSLVSFISAPWWYNNNNINELAHFTEIQCAGTKKAMKKLQFMGEKRTDAFLISHLKVWSELMLRMWFNREFQHRGPATEKDRSPALLWVWGIVRFWLERRPLQPGLLRLRDSVINCGSTSESGFVHVHWWFEGGVV